MFWIILDVIIVCLAKTQQQEAVAVSSSSDKQFVLIKRLLTLTKEALTFSIILDVIIICLAKIAVVSKQLGVSDQWQLQAGSSMKQQVVAGRKQQLFVLIKRLVTQLYSHNQYVEKLIARKCYQKQHFDLERLEKLGMLVACCQTRIVYKMLNASCQLLQHHFRRYY